MPKFVRQGNNTLTGNNTFTGTNDFQGTTTMAAVSPSGNFAVATNKFNVAAATGNTDIAGDLVVAGSVLGDRKVTTETGATLAPTAAQSGTLFTLDRAAGVAVTLPALTAAAPVGAWYEFLIITTVTGDTSFTAGAADLLIGGVLAVDSDSSNAVVFDDPDGTDDLVMNMNGDTTGGLVGSWVRFTAVSATRWHVTGVNIHSGNFGTAFA